MVKMQLVSTNETRRWSALSTRGKLPENAKKLFWNSENTESISLSKYSFFPTKGLIRKTEKVDKYVLNPTGLVKVTWDTIISAQAIYLSFMIPFSICFMQETDKRLIPLFEVCFVIDFLLNFNTACFIHGTLVKDRRRIFSHYLSSYFLWDLLSIIPYELFLSGMDIDSDNDHHFDYWYWPQLFWLIRLTRLGKLRRLIYNIEDIYPSPMVYMITRIFVFLLIAGLSFHWAACLIHSTWYFSLSTNGDMWKNYTKNIFDQYMKSFELATITMLTVGYGNITPQTIPEKMIIIVIQGCASLIIGYLFGGVISTIKYTAKDKIYFSAIRQKMSFFMKKHKLPRDLRYKIDTYLDHLYDYQKQNVLDEQDILGSLSQPLQREIYIRTRGNLLTRIPPFRDYSYKFLKYLGQKLEVDLFSPSDLVFKYGQIDRNIYLVRRGVVEIFHQKTGTIYTEIHKEKYFGEIGFFLGRKRCASARCSLFTELFSLNWEVFNKLLTKLPKEAEITNIIVNNCKGKDLSYLGVRCYFCGLMGHVVENCEKIVYKVNHDEIIKHANFSRKSNRKWISKEDVDQSPRKQEVLRRHGLQNIQGKEINPIMFYQDRNNLITKVKGYDIRRVHKEKTREVMMTVINDDQDDILDKNYHVFPTHLKFGEIYATYKRKTEENDFKGNEFQHYTLDPRGNTKKRVSYGNETTYSSQEM
ncbi:unnamed protein product [Blepharisma stoltei]|uniref:Cyclic nucleotide-binding domain-containing protein n=1 Tax=Blepharisma stoltei TaxID=1481888 RepID=A0AAU9IN06_9CILI|nr:unnamed protein product [Blepharisma stoltei]